MLIRGETGVGKELAARAIHALSERSDKPFIAVNCGAIPESLVESTLFGHEKIVAATNCELERAVAEGGFRKDLYYRINVVKLAIPPLAERKEDIPRLVELILKRLAARYRKSVRGVAPELMERLKGHSWPGNVRELENTLEPCYSRRGQNSTLPISAENPRSRRQGQASRPCVNRLWTRWKRTTWNRLCGNSKAMSGRWRRPWN